ncbi:iron chelate uptake ABC transporter family permease subunit, partial [Staphylococcus hominis]|uniref:iron chelate uptake ABC transporter family permease subunit n=1 Tax=Staphylococcus hominis TaxID=1290 RepID=UPI0011A7019A
YEILYLGIGLLIIGYIFANEFRIGGMGKDFSDNLGVKYEEIINIGVLMSGRLRGLVVVRVGRLGFLGSIVG